MQKLFILIPGGPGNSSSADFKPNHDFWMKFPKNWGFVFYSPRGANASFFADADSTLTPETLSIEQQVQDLVKIRKLFASAQVWLYGFSHGGVVALEALKNHSTLFEGVLLENPSLGYDCPDWRIPFWSRQNWPKTLDEFQKLRKAAKSKDEQVFFTVMSRFIAIAPNYILKAGEPTMPFFKRDAVEEVIQKCLTQRECIEMRKFREWIEPRLNKPYYSGFLADSVGCVNLGWTCKDDVALNKISHFVDYATPAAVLILKSENDLVAETTTRINQFFKSLNASKKKLIIHKRAGHNIRHEDQHFVKKALIDFIEE